MGYFNCCTSNLGPRSVTQPNQERLFLMWKKRWTQSKFQSKHYFKSVNCFIWLHLLAKHFISTFNQRLFSGHVQNNILVYFIHQSTFLSPFWLYCLEDAVYLQWIRNSCTGINCSDKGSRWSWSTYNAYIQRFRNAWSFFSR